MAAAAETACSCCAGSISILPAITITANPPGREPPDRDPSVNNRKPTKITLSDYFYHLDYEIARAFAQ